MFVPLQITRPLWPNQDRTSEIIQTDVQGGLFLPCSSFYLLFSIHYCTNTGLNIWEAAPGFIKQGFTTLTYIPYSTLQPRTSFHLTYAIGERLYYPGSNLTPMDKTAPEWWTTELDMHNTFSKVKQRKILFHLM